VRDGTITIPMRPTASALVLFDIDGTLMRKAGPHHRRALEAAVRRVTGLETTTDGVPLSGMLDPDIIAAIMRRAGASGRAIRDAMPAIIESAQRIYVRTCPVLERRVCPGVRQALRRFERRGMLMALVTGNLTRIGWKKVERAGLREFFAFGAFGEMAPTRARLARLAIRQARSEGRITAGTPIALIGDTPADIAAARANGARAVAVATGLNSAEELQHEGPDILLDDLRAIEPGMLL